MVTMGTRKLWTCWQGRLRWNAELPLKYVGYMNVVSSGSAVQSVALLTISAMTLWASSDKGPRVYYYYYFFNKSYDSTDTMTKSCGDT